ncbi:hypothetical protein Q3G72_003884 [Acer saccharum]|nr:hypothetical protein Q3G72_003884 [Acer saccharum]
MVIGGYSDDMTLAAIAGAHKRLITSPPVAVFPHPLATPYVMAIVHIAAALRIYVKGYSVEETNIISGGLLLVSCLAICTAIELLSMWNLTRIEVQLCNLLSPEAPRLSLATYNWVLIPLEEWEDKQGMPLKPKLLIFSYLLGIISMPYPVMFYA